MDSMWDPMVDEQLWPWDGTQDGRQTAQETGQDDLVFQTSYRIITWGKKFKKF